MHVDTEIIIDLSKKKKKKKRKVHDFIMYAYKRNAFLITAL